MRRLFLFIPCLFLVPASAETTATTTFQVGAQVQSSCRVQADDLRFAALEKPNIQRLDAGGSLIVHCTRGTFVGLSLDYGQNPHPETGERRLSGEGEFALGYRLQSQKAETAATKTGWEEPLPTLVSDGSRQVLTLYGELTEAPEEPRFLSDTLTITLVY